jgi:hypothetical protein
VKPVIIDILGVMSGSAVGCVSLEAVLEWVKIFESMAKTQPEDVFGKVNWDYMLGEPCDPDLT